MLRSLLVLAIALIAFQAAYAQIGPEVPDVVVAWEAVVRPPASAPAMTDTFRPGETAFVTLIAQVADEWHLYSLGSPSGRPLIVEFDELPEGISLNGSPSESSVKRAYDPGLDEDYTYHDGRARIWQRLSISDSAQPGPTVVTGTIKFAACREGLCLPVREVPFEARFNIAG